jgi:hypothetical protein
MTQKKEDHDGFIDELLKTASSHEVLHNLTEKPSIESYEAAFTLLLEELEETEEALAMTKQYVWNFFQLIRMNADAVEMNKHMELIAFSALETMHEALQIRAVALKTISQIKKEPTDGNQ